MAQQDQTTSRSRSHRRTIQSGPNATSVPAIGNMLLQGPHRWPTVCRSCLRGRAENQSLVLVHVPGRSELSHALFQVEHGQVAAGGLPAAPFCWWRSPGRLPTHLSRRASSSWHVPGTCRARRDVCSCRAAPPSWSISQDHLLRDVVGLH